MKVSVTLLFAVAAAVMAQDTVSVTAGGDCEPHGDHWHCAPGVAEPTTPPTPQQLASHSAEEAAEDATTATVISSGTALITPSPSAHDHDDDDHDHDHKATASTCEPHGDHWHCPAGVAEPTTPPPAIAVSGTATVTSARSPSGSPTPQQTGNTAAHMGASSFAALLGAIAYFM
ncbi:hypothetical protein ACJQWK_01641 [Exserohilum turcicum]|uniref:Uncharacterized protein n=1 Tax=Exserohilum turcicum (strain 28A) TaxID=671987 RepID=R0JYS6_EXST2|nr:uncharacterized protein SETTUDRAFT_110679 [Exserohilum turcica Et28A]EOA86043.1 hypothetical protein SETTUDRAFT_110679 [Exserohilum turcica Et28A]